MLLIILAIWFGYKKARDSGRNPYLWAAISGGVFVGVQLIVGIIFGTLIVIGQQLWGWNDQAFERYQIFASIPAILLSWLAIQLVFRYLDRAPDTTPETGPPPPPTFDQSE